MLFLIFTAICCHLVDGSLIPPVAVTSMNKDKSSCSKETIVSKQLSEIGSIFEETPKKKKIPNKICIVSLAKAKYWSLAWRLETLEVRDLLSNEKK